MKKVFVFSALILFVVTSACGGTSTAGGDDGKTGTVNYAGPGSVRKMVIDNAAGTAIYTESADVNSAPTLTVNATFVRQASEFIKFTVTSATGTGAPTAGTLVYGFEIPSMALLLKPMDGQGDNIIPLVVAGECPSGTFEANWIKLRSRTDADASLSCNVSGGRDWFGTFKYENATPSLPAQYSLATNYDKCTTSTGLTGATGTCSNGILDITEEDGTLSRLFLTAAGGAIVQTNALSETDQEHVVGFPQQTVAIADLAGEYYGLVFTTFPESGDDVFPVGGTIAGSTMTGYEINPDTGVKTGSEITFDLETANSPSTGFIKVTAHIDGGSQKMICQAAINVGPSANKKNILNCISQDKVAFHYYNLMLVSK